MMALTQAERAKRYRDGKRNKNVTKRDEVTESDESAIQTNVAFGEPNLDGAPLGVIVEEPIEPEQPWDVEKWRRGEYTLAETYRHLHSLGQGTARRAADREAARAARAGHRPRTRQEATQGPTEAPRATQDTGETEA
jgi:hypothetical protein